jgi:transcriptional regulator with XRE-family HTH domain
MEWWERLRGWIDERGWKPPELARRSGVNKDAIYKWLAGGVTNPRGSDLDRVLNCLDKSELELFYGLSEARLTQLKEIPLLNMLNLGKLKRGQAAREVWDGVSTTTVGADVSGEALGVVLDDESCAPEFHAHDIVIIEPDKPLIPGKYVIAVLEGEPHAVFRRYRPSGISAEAPFKLVATNPDYPEIDVTDAAPGFVVARATKHIRDI